MGASHSTLQAELVGGLAKLAAWGQTGRILCLELWHQLRGIYWLVTVAPAQPDDIEGPMDTLCEQHPEQLVILSLRYHSLEETSKVHLTHLRICYLNVRSLAWQECPSLHFLHLTEVQKRTGQQAAC